MRFTISKILLTGALAGALAGCGADPSSGDLPDAAPSAQAEATISAWIYQDALASPWIDWSWASRNMANTSPVYSGTRSISVNFGAWQGLYFHQNTAFASNGYGYLDLSVNGGSSGGGSVILVRAVLSNGTSTSGARLGTYCTGGTIPNNAWTTCRVPMTAIAPAGSSLTGLVLQEGSGKSLPTLYFDAIGLEPVGSTTSVAVAVSPTSASLSAGQTQQFTATVTGNTNTAVTWSVQEGSAGGAVTSAGLYTAPSTAGTYHVVATSQADTTKSAAATVTVAGGGTGGGGGGSAGKESWVWVYTDFSNVLTAIGAHVSSFTHVSPTFYTVNYNYQSGVAYYSNCPNISNCSANGSNNFSGLTTQQFTQRVKGMGLKTVPAIYGGAGNSGTDSGILNLLNNTNGAGDAFVTAMVNEAVANGYDGYNLDWETGSAVNGNYADKFVAFVNKFKAALGAHGMSLSADAIVSNINGTWCSSNSGFIDFPKLAASSIDRIMIEDYVNSLGTPTTTCQNVKLSTSSPASCDFTFTGELNMMCTPNLPVDKAVIGVMADPSATNPIAGQAFSAIRSYGFTRVAVWPQAPFMNTSGIQPAGTTWYGLLQTFLSQ